MKTFKEILGIDYVEGMSTEEIEKRVCAKYEALAGNEPKLREAVSKANSEAANWKKKYNETLSEEERNKVARDEELNKYIQENTTLKKEKAISEHYANYVALGYSEELARDTANALVENDYDKVLANQKAFLAETSEKMKQEAMKKNPTPPAGNPNKITKADFDKMSYEEMVKLQTDNPTLYNELSK